jgi:hypothetical protein
LLGFLLALFGDYSLFLFADPCLTLSVLGRFRSLALPVGDRPLFFRDFPLIHSLTPEDKRYDERHRKRANETARNSHRDSPVASLPPLLAFLDGRPADAIDIRQQPVPPANAPLFKRLRATSNPR